MSSGQSSYAAIDTGTTLVGGPQNYIEQIYQQIPGSRAGSGSYEGYYTFRQSMRIDHDTALLT